MISIVKVSQNVYQNVYKFVPIQDFSEPWTDEKLYKKYGLTEKEIEFIESMIRPMDLNDNQ
jgi:site-specific DNA-methyltransferase (adenine-specific)